MRASVDRIVIVRLGSLALFGGGPPRRFATAALALAFGLGILAPAAAAKPLSPAPVITSISPASAYRGATVTVLGSNFGGPRTKVSVGGMAAVVTSSTGSRATFTVPATAPLGLTTVRLANPSGQSASVPFTVLFDGHLTPLLEAAGAVTATIGRLGGSLASGDLRLDIPAGALSEDVQITMTPLRGVSGTPFDQTFLGGAQLSPEGLAFLAPAQLSLPLPAGVRAADVLGFGSTGSGGDVHLVPRSVAGGWIVIPIWHFTTASASSAGAAGASAMQAYTPTAAEAAALQAIAIANAACAQELAQEIYGGPACQDVDGAHLIALRTWYLDSVAPGLTAAIGAPIFTVESAYLDWLRWWGYVQEAPSAAQQGLEPEVAIARSLAGAALADTAVRRLDNCTGTDLESQVRDVGRLADLALAGAFTEPLGPDIPTIADGEIVRACASIRIDEVAFPATAARGTDRNTLTARASLDVWSGPNRTDVPITLEFVVTDGYLLTTPTPGADGRFEAKVSVDADAPAVQIEMKATGQSAVLEALGIDKDQVTVAKAARDRLTLDSVGAVDVGESTDIKAWLAGDDVAGETIAFSLSGPGSLSTQQSTTAGDGSAKTTYTAPESAGTATVTATFVDGPDTRTRSVTITIDSDVSVAIDPETVILGVGQQQQFSATVTGAQDSSVTWSSSCGTVGPTGLYVAPATAGSCTVTATSVEESGASATAIVTVQGGSIQGTIEQAWAGGAIFACAQSPDGGPFGTGCTFSTSPDTTMTWTDEETRTASYQSSSSTATASQNYLVTFAGSQARQFSASGAASASADGLTARAGGGTDFDAQFTVVGAPVTYHLTASVTLAESPNWDGGCLISFEGNGDPIVDEPCDGSGTHTVTRSGTLMPGSYDFEIFVNANAQILFGTTSDAASGSFSVSLTLG